MDRRAHQKLGESTALHPARESKRQRFERLAQRRVTETLRCLRLVGNLANRNNYEYTEDHVRQLTEALDAEMRQLKLRFRQEGVVSGNTFSFRK